MSKNESVLTAAEKESFEIEKFIFHIILKEELNPKYLEELELVDENQIRFFKDRFKDVAEGAQHIFKDKENSGFYRDCKDLLNDTAKEFLPISKKLTAGFKERHNKNMNDGVFVVSIVKVNNDRRLLFLLKIDHKKVYEYSVKGNKALLSEITQTFVEDKKAIQKAALIDITDHYGWDVLAIDRTATGKVALRTYFSGFLEVIERETASTLTPKVISAIKNWAMDGRISGELKKEVSVYKNKVIDYLKGTPKFKTKDCIEAIIADEPEVEQEALRKSLKNFLDDKGISGQRFSPALSRIDVAARKNIRKTEEGVIIQWEGDAKELGITIPVTREQDGLYHIVIATSYINVVDKDV